jgi:hypothetical protein
MASLERLSGMLVFERHTPRQHFHSDVDLVRIVGQVIHDIIGALHLGWSA